MSSVLYDVPGPAARRRARIGSIVGALVVLPQAVRSVVPPLINVFIALAKNTSVAAGFAVVELTGSGRRIALANPADTVWALVGVALFYLLITIPAGLLAGGIERKVAFAR